MSAAAGTCHSLFAQAGADVPRHLPDEGSQAANWPLRVLVFVFVLVLGKRLAAAS